MCIFVKKAYASFRKESAIRQYFSALSGRCIQAPIACKGALSGLYMGLRVVDSDHLGWLYALSQKSQFDWQVHLALMAEGQNSVFVLS